MQKVEEGVSFVFCLHAPVSGAIQEYASYFNTDELSVSTQIRDSILALYGVKEEVPPNYKSRIRLLLHKEIVTTSFWMVDGETDNAHIQLDFKLVNATSRRFSFGVELIETGAGLFDNVKASYLTVVKNSEPVTKKS